MSYSCQRHIFKCSFVPVVWNSWCFRGWKKFSQTKYIEEMNVCVAYPFCGFWHMLVNKRVTLERVGFFWGGKRDRVFEVDVFIENTCLGVGSKNAGRNSNVDVVLSRSHGSPGQWFPETEYLCASAIFVVGTIGIPPNLNYRSVSPIISTHVCYSMQNFVYIYIYIYTGLNSEFSFC